MSNATPDSTIPFVPTFRHKRSALQFRSAAHELMPIVQCDDPVAYIEAVTCDWEPDSLGISASDTATWKAAYALLTDLWLQGWQIVVSEQQVGLRRPARAGGTEERLRRQMQLSVKRTDQLARKSVRRFIEKIEKPGAGVGRRTILDLITDGEDLARSLEEHCANDTPVVRPVLVPVVSGERCKFTGLLLTDIWRYFRHTWTSPYESVPGRSLLLLVRDAAREKQPVIGIAALSSAAVKQQRRDRYIGWTLAGAVELVKANPRRRWKNWIERSLKGIWSETYTADLIRDGVLASASLDDLHAGDVEMLRGDARSRREEHHAQPNRREFGTDVPHRDEEWIERAITPLFRSKRSEKLAMLIQLWVLHRRLAANRSKKYASQLVESADGITLLDQTVRLAKGKIVGTAIADLSVCGAIPPYNELIGGKLVALLAVSEAARTAYHERYQRQPSLIASSIAGREIVRPADLVFVGTSSLYGVRPNQYDTLSMPVSDEPGETMRLRYQHLGKSEGYGSLHIRSRTKALLQAFMLADGRTGWRANNIFGEGANPNMRALREAIGALGLDANELLQHSQPREIYGVALASNLAEYVLGVDRNPDYIKRKYSRGSDSEAIADFWWRRWAGCRSCDEQVLARIRKHSLAYPIAHGAVLGPSRTESNAPSMFADL